MSALCCAGIALAGCSSVARFPMRGFSPCKTTTVSIYFESDSSEVSPIAGQVVSATAKRLKGCPVKELRLLGLADPAGSPQANLELSQQRADHVFAAFINAGLPVTKYSITAAGANGSVTEEGAVEPVRRRVNVSVIVGR
jgi:outer membrane protein OmpA-like peptidoglycan-associated protein